MAGVNQVSWNLIFNIFILIMQNWINKNQLFDYHNINTQFLTQSFMKFLAISTQNLPILSVFITLLLRLCKGQLQPGGIKADSLPQIFHTLMLHHKVGFDQGGPAEFTP